MARPEALQAAIPLGDITSEVFGSPDDPAISLSIRENLAMVQVFARKGQEDAVARKLGLSAKPGKARSAKGVTNMPLSPGQWMLVAEKGNDGSFAGKIAATIEGVGYVSEQSDARVCIRVSGRDVRELMARGCRLDLHERVTSAGFCAQTVMAQTGVLLHQVSDAPEYDLYVYSGFAQSFWHWLTATAAQFALNTPQH